MAYTQLFSIIVLCLGSVRCDDFYVEQRGKPTMHCGSGTMVEGIIQWKYNSQLIMKENVKTGGTVKGSAPMAKRASLFRRSLRITELQTGDAGKYICERDDGGRIEHQLYVASVSVSPALPLLQGTSADLRCQISGGSELKPVWFQPSGTRVETTDAGLVTLQSVDMASSGKWTCQLEPDILKINMQISVLGLRSTPNLTVSAGESVLLPCITTHSLPDSLRLQEGGWERLSPESRRLLSLNTSSNKLSWDRTEVKGNILWLKEEKLDSNFSVTLKKVTRQQSGLYRCFLKFQGKGTLSTQVLLEVKETYETYGPDSNGLQIYDKNGLLGLNLWVWLAVGASCLVLIVLIGITVYLTRRNKRMKRRARKLRSMRQPLTARDYCQCNRNTAEHPNGRKAAPPVRQCQR